MKHPIRMIAGDLVNHLRGYSQSTPVNIKGDGPLAHLSYEDGAVVIERVGEKLADTVADVPAPHVVRIKPRRSRSIEGGDAA